MKKILNRIVAILPALILQAFWYLMLLRWFEKYIPVITFCLSVLAFLLILHIISKRDEPTYKILWLAIIYTFPIFGAWLYLFYGNRKTAQPLDRKIEKAVNQMKHNTYINEQINKKIENEDKRIYQIMDYISSKKQVPITYTKDTKFYSLGEYMYEDMIVELEKAKKFIFIEYFIISEGKFWSSIEKILEKKVSEGIDVRVMFDDLGSITTYSMKSIKEMVQKGIKCMPFNAAVFVKGTLNNRNHRKMMIIDNEVCFSGGVNIADEYINEKVKYGHWKDIGFKLTGDAVSSYTKMFMSFWNAFSKEKIPNEYIEKELENVDYDNGYVLSYYDSPGDEEHFSNNLYTELLSSATNYVWFYTPYLLLGDNLMDAFIRCAKRGVDVRLYLPGIPDKKIINRLSKSYYHILMEAGVKIYEYDSGFVHAKACIVDDKIATIGTVNLDYRSLFLHYECNSIFYKSKMVSELKQDFKQTQEKCHRVSEKEISKRFILNSLLRIFAPLC